MQRTACLLVEFRRKRFDSIKLKGNMQLLCRKLCQIGYVQAFEGLPGQKSRERRSVGERFRQRRN